MPLCHAAKVSVNARMATRRLKEHCKLNQDSQELIRVAMNELHLSARTYDRILKVSRTIADLDGKSNISPEHVSAATQDQTFDQTTWISLRNCHSDQPEAYHLCLVVLHRTRTT